MDITSLIKDCVKSVCRSAEFIDILIIDDTLVIDIADTALAIINLGFDFKGVRAFRYNEKTIDSDISPSTRIDGSIENKLLNYWNEYDKLVHKSPIAASCEDLRAQDDYEELLALKATDGLRWYKMPYDALYEYCMVPVFSGFPNINKADKIGLIVYNIDYDTLLMEYHIYKKKINREIIMWFRTIDISKSLIQYKYHE